MASNELAFAVRDRFPVSPGHTLIVSRRLVQTWFDATPERFTAGEVARPNAPVPEMPPIDDD